MSHSRLRVISALILAGLASSALSAEIDTPEKKFSYVLGIQFGQQLKNEGIMVDADAFATGIDDVLRGNSPKMSMQEMQAALQAGKNKLIMEKQAEAQAAMEVGKVFLEKNKKQKGVVVLPSGLQYIELKAGKGNSPGVESKVTVHYRGALIDGTVFDSSYKRGEPTSFSLDGVIPGFREAISMMKPGAKWKVFIPSDLGYGPNGAGGAIGPNETLIFEIELLSVEEE